MKKLFILLVSFNSFILSAYSEDSEVVQNLNLSYDEVLSFSCEERIKKTSRFNYCSHSSHLRDGDVFSDFIHGSNFALDYKTVTNKTDEVVYVSVRYEGAITYGLYGYGPGSFWYTYLQPNECVKVYQSNSDISPDFYNPFVVKLELTRNNDETKRFCYPCSSSRHKNYTVRDFFIGYHLSESDTANESCGNSVDLKWLSFW